MLPFLVEASAFAKFLQRVGDWKDRHITCGDMILLNRRSQRRQRNTGGFPKRGRGMQLSDLPRMESDETPEMSQDVNQAAQVDQAEGHGDAAVEVPDEAGMAHDWFTGATYTPKHTTHTDTQTLHTHSRVVT